MHALFVKNEHFAAILYQRRVIMPSYMSKGHVLLFWVKKKYFLQILKCKNLKAKFFIEND